MDTATGIRSSSSIRALAASRRACSAAGDDVDPPAIREGLVRGCVVGKVRQALCRAGQDGVSGLPAARGFPLEHKIGKPFFMAAIHIQLTSIIGATLLPIHVVSAHLVGASDAQYDAQHHNTQV